MATYEPKKPLPEPAKTAPAVDPHQDHHEAHNPFGDWIPEIVGSVNATAGSLMHFVDPPHAAPADPKVAAQGAAYAKQLVALQDTTNTKQGHYQMLNMLESVDDPAVRHEMMEQFQKATGKPLEQFIKQTSWDGKRDQTEALSLISPERDQADAKLAAMPKEERAALRHESFEAAEKILKVAGKDSANDDENARQMADALAGKSPEQIEAIRMAVRTSTHGQQGTYELIDRALSGGNEDEAFAQLQGGGVHATVIALENAKDDPKRMREVLERVDTKSDRAELSELSPWLSGLTAKMPEGERKEMRERLAGNVAKANADRITDLLRDDSEAFSAEVLPNMQFGPGMAQNAKAMGLAQEAAKDREPKNVLRELERMSPEEMKEAHEAYNPKDHGGKTWDEMVKDKFGDDVAGKRIAALMNGDRVGDRALELREAMRTHDQKGIEHALANDDLASKDPAKHARGVVEQQELEMRMRALDTTPFGYGRTVEQQLADSNKEYVEGKIDPFKGMGGYLDKVYNHDKREDAANDYAVADEELLHGGKLSLATEAHRAGKEQRAELLENADAGELAEAQSDHKTKYKKDLLEGPDLEPYRIQAMQEQIGEVLTGKTKRPIEDIEYQLARKDMDVNEVRLDNVRTEGAKSERSKDQLESDQKDIYERQHSDRLEKVEAQREWWGGGIGSQHLQREGIAAMEEQNRARHWTDFLKGGPVEDDVRDLDHVTTAEQQTARAEKIELAERSSKYIKKAADLLADVFPEAGKAIKLVGGLVAAYEKKDIGGEAVNGTAELVEVGIDSAGDYIGDKLGGEGPGAGKKALKEAEKAGDKLAIEEAKKEIKEATARKLVGATTGSVLKTETKQAVMPHVEPDKKVEQKSGGNVIVESVFDAVADLTGDSAKEGFGEHIAEAGHEILAPFVGYGAQQLTKAKVKDAGEVVRGEEPEKKKEGESEGG